MAIDTAVTVLTEREVEIGSCEFWVAQGVRAEFPAGGRLARLNFPLTLSIDAPVSVDGIRFQVKSAGVLINGAYGVMVYGLR